ncbi:hypothetical protein [Parasphingorhabdus sp.]|uniref:hypothetical protein n=1 Tax=Parasphingorhabdus sp. TaxID=2709688 RepID=UPI0032999979
MTTKDVVKQRVFKQTKLSATAPNTTRPVETSYIPNGVRATIVGDLKALYRI